MAPTDVDEERLDYWKERLPRRLHRFMDNFFGTCHGYPPQVNFLNYVMDLDLYGATTKEYRENRGELIDAFYDVTGWRPTSAV